MKKIKINRHEREEISRVVHRFLEARKSQVAMITLFGGDRATCCDECLIATDDADEFVGMVSISYQGELGNGQPEIVGLYVVPECRLLGVGLQLLEAAVRRVLSTEDTVRLQALSRSCVATANKLPKEFVGRVEVIDQSSDDFGVLDL